mmetsp:Transcript_5804/g.18682  ORF Transcript_5804/g.18682 Transcript_5804/m.18682 type:complete len:260 (-) Transcript_5804:132-911(-)
MPGADMKDPAAHGLHLNRPLASATRICPGSQSAHCPACLAAGVQSEQAEAPAADARPAGQGMQASPPAEYQVAGHSLQNPHPTQSPAPCPPVAAAPAAEGSNPGLHVARQLSREGDAKVPDGQAEQLVPGTAEKLRVCGEGGALSFTPSAFSQIIPHPASWDTHVPAPQTAQAGWSDASGPVESPWPTGQVWPQEVREMEEKVPAAHDWQAEAPPPEKVPAGQERQVDMPTSEYIPGAHTSPHAAARPVAVEKEPPAHT